ncbi:MAG: D-hexose-6-phosphate mutarotase [Leptothrix sp. (in: b-proteobacteria)]
MSEPSLPRASRPTGPFDFNGQPAVQLRAPGGAQAVVLLHGAHVVSWQPAGSEEQLYLSPTSAYGGTAAIRGGVPVIFPQFASQGPLPKHGFVRNRAWTLQETQVRGEHAFAVLHLTDDDSTRAIWPHAFELELTVSVNGKQLDMELSVLNTGATPIEFQAALHTYLRTQNVLKAQLEGLQGIDYHNSLRGDDNRQWTDVLTVVTEIDRIYWNVQQPLTLREIGRRISISQDGFTDVVAWNPGADKCAQLPDMPAEGWREMLCVEAAQIGDRMRLAPGQEWAGTQTLVAA